MSLVVDLNAKKDSLGYFEFVQPILAAIDAEHQVFAKHYTQVHGGDLSRCERMILSGTPLKDNLAWQQPEKFQWLKSFDKPVLGICAGMQTIASVFDLKVKPCLEIGMTQIETIKENPLFSGSFSAYTLHNFAVQSNETFDELAQSKNCVQAIKHKHKPVYGVLFHPEVRTVFVLERFLAL